tara:strand:- start:453 stop:926 length:474 start_codon:yes stop_codon:yes gene_type:complete
MPIFDFHDLSRFKNIKQLENAVRHATRTGRKFEEQAVTEHRRKLLVELETFKDEFEKYFWMQVVLYEEVLSQKSEKKNNVKAMKTRQALKKMTIHEFLIKLMRKNKTQGFRLLEDEGREDAAYENVIIKFKDRFFATPDVIEIAHERLNLKAQKKSI